MNLTTIATLITEIGVLLSVVIPIMLAVRKIANGTLCQLRSEMLRIYYYNRESRQIREFEYENFVLLYEAYKALNGNSFIKKIHDDVESWEIISKDR